MANLNINTPLQGSYVYVNKPHTGFDGKEKYQLDLLIPETLTEVISQIEAAEQAAIQEGLTKVFNGKAPSKSSLKSVLKDGNEKEDPVYHGCRYITATSKVKPTLVGSDPTSPLGDDEIIVGGDYICVSLNLKAYNVGGQKGVTAYIQAVQLVKKGEPFGKKDPTKDFVAHNNEEFI